MGRGRDMSLSTEGKVEGAKSVRGGIWGHKKSPRLLLLQCGLPIQVGGGKLGAGVQPPLQHHSLFLYTLQNPGSTLEKEKQYRNLLQT